MFPSAIRHRLTLAATFALLLLLTLPLIAQAKSNSSHKLTPSKSSQGTSATASNITIYSTTSWQQTPLTVQQGANFSFTVSYLSGTWTVDVNNFPYVGPDGYPPNIDQQIPPGCKYDNSLPYATLLGQIGNGNDFAVSTGGTFTAAQSGTLYLRINDQDACLGDNAGSIVLTVYNEVKNFTWGGYISSFTNTNDTPLNASGAWTVPSVSCTMKNGNPISGYFYVWVGLGGYQSGNTLEQIGTTSQCINGQATYWAWYELFPSMSNPYPLMKDGNYPISAGDAMRADVTDQGHGYFVLRIFDDNQKWPNAAYIKIWTNQNANAIPQTSEWIVEYPYDIANPFPFPQFNDVVFTNCYWIQNSSQEALITGSNLTRATIYTYASGQIANPPKETTQDILPDGTDFTVSWKNS